MNNKNINTMLSCVVLTALFFGTVVILTPHTVYASHKSSGSSNQQNRCGNDDLTINVICENYSSKGHGKGNAIMVNSTQHQ
jgi:hypothetical protein